MREGGGFSGGTGEAGQTASVAPPVWGNPFVVGSELIGGKKLTAKKSVALYRQYACEAFNERDLRACLRGKNLACWCSLDQP